MLVVFLGNAYTGDANESDGVPIHCSYIRTVFTPGDGKNGGATNVNEVFVSAYQCDAELVMELFEGGRGSEYLKEIIGFDKRGVWSRINQTLYVAALDESQMKEKSAILIKFLGFAEDFQTILRLKANY